MPAQLFDIARAACLDPMRRILELPGFCTTGGQRKDVSARLAQVGAALRQSRRFVVDDDLTAIATELTHRPASFLTEALHRSRLPFDHMWIEYNKHVQIDIANRNGYGDPRSDAAPPRSGFLLSRLRGRDTTFSAMVITDSPNSSSNAFVLPFGFVWDTEEAVDPYVPPSLRAISDRINAAERNTPGVVALSSPYLRANSGATTTLQESVRTVMADPWEASSLLDRLGRNDQALVEIASEVAGDFRLILALLGLLNTLRKDTEHVQPQGGRLVGTRHVVYMDYHTVRLRLPKERINARLHRLFAADSRRAHEVMGHWVQRRNGTRYWRKSHVRGDATIGFVQKSYELLPRQ